MRALSPLLALAVVLILGVAWRPKSGGPPVYGIEAIVDASTRIPGSVESFTGFGDFPAVDGDAIWFTGRGKSADLKGVYAWGQKELTVAADARTVVPGTARTFASFGEPAAADGVLVFRGEGIGSARDVRVYSYIGGKVRTLSEKTIAVCRFKGGALEAVATDETAIPEGKGSFRDFEALLGADSHGFVVAGYGAYGQRGIYATREGHLVRVADLKTPIPGGRGTFSGFGRGPRINGTEVVFTGYGRDGQTGVYRFDGASISVVADTNTMVASGRGRFGAFAGVTADDGHVTWIGRTEAGDSSLCLMSGNSLEVVADSGGHPPGRRARFDSFEQVALDGSDVAFTARGAWGQGLYVRLGGVMGKVVETGDEIAGRKVRDIRLGPAGLSRAVVAFTVVFDDGGMAVCRGQPVG